MHQAGSLEDFKHQALRLEAYQNGAETMINIRQTITGSASEHSHNSRGNFIYEKCLNFYGGNLILMG